MCRYCRYLGLSCSIIDEWKLFGICGDFSKRKDMDMSDCYWKNHRIFYAVVKTILYYLPIIILGMFLLVVLFCLFRPDIFVIVFVAGLSIAVVVFIFMVIYRLYLFFQEGIEDVK